MQSLPYRTALVTGASSGIGEALARDLARLKVNLVLVARSEDKLHLLAETLRRENITVDVIAMDLVPAEAAQKLYSETQHRGITVDLLINNAGFGAYGSFHELPGETSSRMIDLNVKTLVQLTHLFLPAMVQNNHGAVMNVSSAAGFQAVPFMANYAATKAFVTNFTMALAAELKHTGITFVALCPGRTRTNFQLAAGSNKIRIKSRAATVEDVSRVAICALQQKRLIAIEGFSNKAVFYIQRLFSRKFALRIAYHIFKPKLKPPEVTYEKK